MSDVSQICSELGVKTKDSVKSDRVDLKLLTHLEHLLRANEIAAQATKVISDYVFNKLSTDAKTIFMAVHNQDRNMPASQKITRTIQGRTSKGFKNDDKDGLLLRKMLKIALTAEGQIRGIIKRMPATIQAKHADHLKRQPITDAIAETILVFRVLYGSRFSLRIRVAAARAKNSEAVVNIIQGICRRHKWVKPKVVKPKVVKPKPKSILDNFDWSIRVTPGYGFRPSGDNLSVLAGEGRGVLAQGGLSGSYKFNDRYRLQIDYRSDVPIEVAGKHKDDLVVSNLDDVRISAFMSPLKQLDLLVQIGWINSRYDYPSERTEDLNVFTQQLRVNYRPLSALSVNIDETLQVGWVNQTFPKDTDFTVRALFNAGASYALKVKGITITPFGGGTIGYMMDRELLVYGGYAGASLVFGTHEADLLALYNNVEGLTANARYFYNLPKWGIGARVFYNLYSKDLVRTELDPQKTIGGEIFARVKLASLLKRGIELRPYVRGAFEFGSKASNVLFGIEIRWGALPYANPSPLRPYSLTPLPEDRR